jgi:hypothetical protein
MLKTWPGGAPPGNLVRIDGFIAAAACTRMAVPCCQWALLRRSLHEHPTLSCGGVVEVNVPMHAQTPHPLDGTLSIRRLAANFYAIEIVTWFASVPS